MPNAYRLHCFSQFSESEAGGTGCGICFRYLEGFFFFFSSYIRWSAIVISWKIELPECGTVMHAPMLMPS